MATHKNVKLSDELLEMQFMRGTRQKLEERAKKQQLADMADEYRGRKIPATTNMAKPSRFVFCPDIGYTELMDLRYGRFAFNGANPEIAKIQEEEEMIRLRKHDPNYKDDEEIFKDIPDEEMAYSSFAKARQGRGVMIEPAPQILNIYTDESDKPGPSPTIDQPGPSPKIDESEDFSRPKPSPRYAPYPLNNPRRGRSGNHQRGGQHSNNRGSSHRRGGNNYRGKKK